MNDKERLAFYKVQTALHNMMDGIDGYEEEGFDISRFWKPEEVKFARRVLEILERKRS